MTSVQVYENGKDSALFSIRGTVLNGTMRNVMILVDGIPLYNTESGLQTIDLIPVPVDAIEKVEVVRGPSSSLYGANAQVGVVAITTKKARDGTSLSLRGGAANGHTYNSQGLYAYGSPDFTFTAGFGGSSQRDSGLTERVLGDTRRVDPQDQNHASQVFLRPEVVLDEGRIWAAYGRAANAQGPQSIETATGTPLYTLANLHASTELAEVGWAQAWSPVFRTELKVNRSHLLPISISPFQAIPGSPISAGIVNLLQSIDPGLKSDYDLIDTSTDQVAFQGNWDPSEALHLVFGLDAARSLARKVPIGGIQEDQRNSASGGFLSLEWTLGNATLSTGARVENETLGGSRISPRASLVYKLKEDSVLRAGYFTSTRSPQVGELFQNIQIPGRPATLGNPALVPEVFDNLELGYRRTWTAWSLDLTAYRMNLRKVIVVQPTGLLVGGLPQTQYANSGSPLRNQGLEVTLKGELSPGWLLGFNASTVDLKDNEGLQQAYSAKVKANLWTRYQLGTFQAYVALQQVGAYRMVISDNTTGTSEERPANLQIHFNLGWQVAPRTLVSLYGINAARSSDESTAGSSLNGHLVRFSRREVGLQASWQY
jgi:outer membrane receptor protein involved in Fe transport